VSINIKNPRVHELARRAAALTGESQTSVIERALLRLLDELDADTHAESKRAHVDRILADIHRRVSESDLNAMTIDDLYDESGLPR
jgi:antitoxin VapB